MDQKILPILKEAKEDVMMCKLATQNIVMKFTENSKQQYIEYIDEYLKE